MRRHGNLFEKIVSPENLHTAYLKAAQRKRWQDTVRLFERNLCRNIKNIHEMLVAGTFRTSAYRIKKVYEPKERKIYVLPFAPDRIVQHALMNILSPIWDRIFIYDSYACRPGKGQHRASMRTMDFVRKYKWYYQADIHKFYPSIRHDLMMNIVRKKIKCADTLSLLENIVYSIPGGRNVPIGNYTSQWLGNLFMNELDQYVKHELKIKAYLRYNDDFILFSDSKHELANCRAHIRNFCAERLDLQVKKEKLRPIEMGVDFVGYRHFPDYVLLRKSTAKRVRKRLKMRLWEYVSGKIDTEQLRSSVESTKGWLKWANTYNFRLALGIKELEALYR